MFYIDYYYTSDYGFLNLDNGEIIIRLNDVENIALPFQMRVSDRKTSQYRDNQGEMRTSYSECNFCKMDKLTIEKISVAKYLEIKVRGRNAQEYEAPECEGLIDFFRIFYLGIFCGEESQEYKKLVEKKETESNRRIGVIMVLVVVFTIIIALLFSM